jgi:hypothetical protein
MGRLAVDQAFKGKGLGGALLADALESPRFPLRLIGSGDTGFLQARQVAEAISPQASPMEYTQSAPTPGKSALRRHVCLP